MLQNISKSLACYHHNLMCYTSTPSSLFDKTDVGPGIHNFIDVSHGYNSSKVPYYVYHVPYYHVM